MDINVLAKSLIFFGIIFLISGGLLYFLGKTGLPLGRLPGDIIIQKENLSFYFPIATSIIISILLTTILSLFSKR